MIARARVLTITGCLGLMSLSACEPDKPAFEPSVRSNVQVALPAKPELKVREYKKAHDDGALTVEGLVRQRKSYLGKEVMVRGVVVELVRCPDPTPEEIAAYDAEQLRKREELIKRYGKKKVDEQVPPPKPFQRARTCNPKPQALLADVSKGDRHKLLVAGSMYSPLADLELGATATLTGRFEISSPDGLYVSQMGVMNLEDKPEPPAAQVEGDGEGDGAE